MYKSLYILFSTRYSLSYIRRAVWDETLSVTLLSRIEIGEQETVFGRVLWKYLIRHASPWPLFLLRPVLSVKTHGCWYIYHTSNTAPNAELRFFTSWRSETCDVTVVQVRYGDKGHSENEIFLFFLSSILLVLPLNTVFGQQNAN